MYRAAVSATSYKMVSSPGQAGFLNISSLQNEQVTNFKGQHVFYLVWNNEE